LLGHNGGEQLGLVVAEEDELLHLIAAALGLEIGL